MSPLFGGEAEILKNDTGPAGAATPAKTAFRVRVRCRSERRRYRAGRARSSVRVLAIAITLPQEMKGLRERRHQPLYRLAGQLLVEADETLDISGDQAC